MTKEDWKKIESKLKYVGDYIVLQADGHEITISLQPYKMCKNVLMIFVDGKIPVGTKKEEYKKYMSEHKKSLIRRGTPAREKKRLEKEIGKENLEYISYLPWFNSFGALKSRLNKTCKDIQLIEKPIESEVEGL